MGVWPAAIYFDWVARYVSWPNLMGAMGWVKANNIGSLPARALGCIFIPLG